MSKPYACSVAAARHEPVGRTVVDHIAFVVLSGSEDEATGRAYRVGRVRFPLDEWPNGFSVVVNDLVVEPVADGEGVDP
jgi:hypothetical protein